jgi:hypothetical protein
LAAQELNPLINAVAEGPANAVAFAQIPISSNSTKYLARTTSAPAFQILEIMPVRQPPRPPERCRRGRGRGMRRPCSDQSCSAYFLLRRLTRPPICYSTTCSARTAKAIRPLANHSDFVSGRFLAEKTLLVY